MSAAPSGAATVLACDCAAGGVNRTLVMRRRASAEAFDALAPFGHGPGLPERPASLVVRRTGPSGPFGRDEVIVAGGPPIMGAGFSTLRLAAAGRTMALAFDASDETRATPST